MTEAATGTAIALEIERVRALVAETEEHVQRTEDLVRKVRGGDEEARELADRLEVENAELRARPLPEPMIVEKVIEIERVVEVPGPTVSVLKARPAPEPIVREVVVDRIVERQVEVRVEVPVEIERVVEDPELRARADRLESELAAALARPPPAPIEVVREVIVDRVVEVPRDVWVEVPVEVESPELRARADRLEAELAAERSKPAPDPIETVREVQVDREVRVRVEVPVRVAVENPAQRARADRLEEELAEALSRPEPAPREVVREVQVDRVVERVVTPPPIEIVREVVRHVPVHDKALKARADRLEAELAVARVRPAPAPVVVERVVTREVPVIREVVREVPVEVHVEVPVAAQAPPVVVTHLVEDAPAAPPEWRQDPVHPVPGGYQWGKTGKVYKTKGKAERQARAIYSSGWRDDQKAKIARQKLHVALSAPRAAEAGYVQALVGLLAGVHRGVLKMVREEILPHRPPPPEPEERQDASVKRETVHIGAHGADRTKGESPTGAAGEALEPGLALQSLRRGDGSARADAVKDPKRRGYSAAIAKAWGSGKLGDAIARQLRPRAGVAFERMATRVNANGEKAASLIGIQPGLAGLDDLVDVARDASLEYLEAAGRDYSDEVRAILEDPENFELPVDELEELIEERAGVSASRARTIATTSTLQLNSTLTTERHQAAGIKRFVWSSSRDLRVRGTPGGPYAKADPSHYDLDGQEYDYDDPPESDTDGEPALPGIPINCRCIAVPIVEEFEGEGGEEPDEEAGDEAAE